MSKFSVVVLYFVVATATSVWSLNGLSKEDEAALMEQLKPLAEECGKECGIDKNSLKNTKDDDMSPCFKKCFLRQIGLVNEKGKYDREGIRKSAKELSKNNDDVMKMMDDLDACFDAQGDNKGDDEQSEMKRVEILFNCMKDFKV